MIMLSTRRNFAFFFILTLSGVSCFICLNFTTNFSLKPPRSLVNLRQEIANGTTRIANGTTRIANGTTRIANGTTLIASGTTRIANGTTRIASGTIHTTHTKVTREHSKPSSVQPSIRGRPLELRGLRNVSNISPYFYSMTRKGVLASLPNRYLDGYKSPCWMYGGHTLRCLPYFHIIGFAKSGSTELWEKLKQHPQIYSEGVAKETRWWQMDDGVRFRDYLDGRSAGLVQLFKRNETLKSRVVTGEATPSFVWDNHHWTRTFGRMSWKIGPILTTADLLYFVHPDAKLIFTLREPVTRVYSHYRHFQPNGSPEEFHDLTMRQISKYRACVRLRSVRACTYSTQIKPKEVEMLVSLYHVYLRDWLRVFPRNQIYIQRLEDWNANCNEMLPELYDFLELDTLPTSMIRELCNQAPQHTNTHAHRDMLKETRTALLEFFTEPNRELSKLLGDDRFLWKR